MVVKSLSPREKAHNPRLLRREKVNDHSTIPEEAYNKKCSAAGFSLATEQKFSKKALKMLHGSAYPARCRCNLQPRRCRRSSSSECLLCRYYACRKRGQDYEYARNVIQFIHSLSSFSAVSPHPCEILRGQILKSSILFISRFFFNRYEKAFASCFYADFFIHPSL